MRELVKLDTKQVMESWGSLVFHVVSTLPMEGWSEEKALFAINRGLLDIWVYRGDNGPLAVLSTAVTTDGILGTKSLLVYTASGVEDLELEDWGVMFDGLRKYCAQMGYNQVAAYTRVPRVIEIVEFLGGDTATQLCVLEV